VIYHFPPISPEYFSFVLFFSYTAFLEDPAYKGEIFEEESMSRPHDLKQTF
jgi:hypothetical protein